MADFWLQEAKEAIAGSSFDGPSYREDADVSKTPAELAEVHRCLFDAFMHLIRDDAALLGKAAQAELARIEAPALKAEVSEAARAALEHLGTPFADADALFDFWCQWLVDRGLLADEDEQE